MIVDHGGFDAIIGNPPFLGGTKISGAMGVERSRLDGRTSVAAVAVTGNADLVAYFFLRAQSPAAIATARLGLIATNTVAQGDTREVGLDQTGRDGLHDHASDPESSHGRRSCANSSTPPSGAPRGRVAEDAAACRDGVAVPRISTLLEPEGRTTGDPDAARRERWACLQGLQPLGMGFVVDPDGGRDVARTRIRATPRCSFPYLNGEDLNSDPIRRRPAGSSTSTT